MTRFLHKGKKYSLQGMIAIAAITLGGCSSIDMREAIHGVAKGIAQADITVTRGDQVVLQSYQVNGRERFLVSSGRDSQKAANITRSIRTAAQAVQAATQEQNEDNEIGIP